MNNLELIQAKILNRKKLENQLAVWRFKDKKIVFTNGCFDLLHLGHIDYLSKAKDQGDVLIVGVNTDASVQRLKGENRPVTDEISRSTIMASLQFVSAVVLFDEDTPYDLIQQVQPDVLVKGSDYKPEDIVGYDVVKAKGGEIVTIDFLKGYATTGIIEKLKSE
ncbi:MAG: D-glycero-beta-D-manno-heptose 1-phosphate adenylyltransferase [Bacteroidetes bacterium]|nr:MAG: D-glycero-beta-D-manno-heptose 1-phosphate adenylyltransferase [Bacteroidota bacterium]RLD49148.1 MAG: D-glycero-beta-D-manno-heptose 1-phosphate adenylyltransferase [Bacteroidota bacterium]RLD71754.1 MAG: D-glycero-beta-D-manno-heptose 1-phosphate adenylyltransferase [Bacteroidota bacterium]RLD88965.1 MAG: D-glycero-beta-D-manno-heptose 1-phosphate adenylyltransferase [Bacteroidota bacterium]HHL57613.1 D-glycero-beta-D-manno-heptose 1-phosphate adenylyltransferase [Bacteroidota bacteri